MIDFRLRERLFPPSRLMELLELHAGAHVLEVGPAPGFWLEAAARAVAPGGRAVGLDLQPEMIELASAAGLKAVRAGGGWQYAAVFRKPG